MHECETVLQDACFFFLLRYYSITLGDDVDQMTDAIHVLIVYDIRREIVKGGFDSCCSLQRIDSENIDYNSFTIERIDLHLTLRIRTLECSRPKYARRRVAFETPTLSESTQARLIP